MIADKKILVAYYSKTGNTERVAKEIAARLGADIEKITDLKKRSGILGYIFGARDAMKKRPTEIGELQKNPAEYNLIIMGSPIWGWNATPAITTYINKTRDRIKNTAFFITSGNTNPEKIVPYLEEISGKKTISYVGFNSKELMNDKIYNERLNNFLNTVK
jgi:flavodoxin